jgi:hypothetical protein
VSVVLAEAACCESWSITDEAVLDTLEVVVIDCASYH